MTDLQPAIVLFGDVVDSRRDPGAVGVPALAARTSWTRPTAADRLAPAGFTQGDELQLPAPARRRPVPRRRCAPASTPTARELRWAVVAGDVEPGTGPATERTGPAFLAAREPSSAPARAARGWSSRPAIRPRTPCCRPRAAARRAARRADGPPARGRAAAPRRRPPARGGRGARWASAGRPSRSSRTAAASATSAGSRQRSPRCSARACAARRRRAPPAASPVRAGSAA